MNAALRRAGLGLLVAIAAFGSLLMSGDGRLPRDEDLMATAGPVAEHENGHVTLLAAAELLEWPPDDATTLLLSEMSRGNAWNEALAARALAANAPALEVFARIARNPAFQSPATISAPAGGLGEGVRLAQLVAIRAFASIRAREPEAAVADALLLLHLGGRLRANPHGGLLSAEAGFASAEPAFLVLDRALPALSLTATRSLELSGKLARAATNLDDWRRTLASDYRFERARILTAPAERAEQSPDLALLAQASGAVRSFARILPARYVFQPNNTLALLAAEVRREQQAASEACAPPGAGRARGARSQEPARLSLAALLRPNASGRHFVETGTDRARLGLARCTHDARIALASAAIGAIAFEQERGALPPSLEALAPAYLAAAPVDPFSGAGLRYDRAQRLIYSAGSAARVVLPRTAPS
jgi:hypothetical protein